jgi:type I restriction enzyme M protein
MGEQNNAAFVWSIANLLQGSNQVDFVKVVLPFTVLRRLDSALDATKAKIFNVYKKRGKEQAADFLLQQASGCSFYNTSPYDLKRVAGDTSNLQALRQI